MEKWMHYLAANPDLLNAGITTQTAAERHYADHGRTEGRATVFKWRFYLAANPDLLKNGITTEDGALQHFLSHGFSENRSTTFHWRFYLAANPDLPMQKEDDVLEHFIEHGFVEGRRIAPQLDLHDSSVAVVFVAHSMAIVLELNHDYVNPHILFVGNKTFYKTDNPNVVVARDLPYNIEAQRRLLTLTAWYAVVKNNLYPDFTYLCLLEYDAHVLTQDFCSIVKEAATANVVGFVFSTMDFFSDIRPEILANYLVTKGIDPSLYGERYPWVCTTNLCAPHQFFKEFVDWYDYEYFIEHDNANLSYYHERLVAVFTQTTNKSVTCLDALIHHDQNQSHVGAVYDLPALVVGIRCPCDPNCPYLQSGLI